MPCSFKNGKSLFITVLEKREPIPVFSEPIAGADALCKIKSTCYLEASNLDLQTLCKVSFVLHLVFVQKLVFG